MVRIRLHRGRGRREADGRGGLELNDKRAFAAIGAASVGVVGFLFWLLYFRSAAAGAPGWTSALPTVNACLNFTSAVLLTAGFVAIKNGRRERHRKLMLSACVVAGTFLVSYIVYHHFHGDTRFGGQGLVRPIYFFILVSHIALSMVALPMVLTTLFLAATEQFGRHKKIARFTFPVWLYVSVTGVLVFFFLKLWG